MSQAGPLDAESSNPQIPTSFITDDGTAIPILNELELLADVVPNAGIPFESTGVGNVVTYQIQYADESAATDATKVGLAAFDSASFDVDANGYVSLLGGGTAATNIDVDANTAPGTDPVVPNGSGNITITGAQVAAGTIGTNVLRTNSLAANSLTVEVQRSSASVGTDITLNGVCHFDAATFGVDPNGFVTLAGGGQAIDSIAVQTGTSPVVPTVAGLVTINGAVVAAGTNPVRSDGTGANTLALEVQISQAIAATDATKIGLAAFDSTDFSVDANGFVALSGTGAGQTITGDSGGALSPTAGNWDILGQQAGTVAVMDTVGTAPSTLRVEDRTWRSQYVVDASATVGLRGTFTTIQAAITQAFADQPLVKTTIFIRPGTYATNLTIPAGALIHLTSDSFYSDQNSNLTAVLITGTITCASVCDFSASNVFISGVCTFSAVGEYTFQNVSFGAALNISGVSTEINLALNCMFNTVNHSSTGISRFEGCQYATFNISDGTVLLKNCYELADVTMSGSGSLKAQNCMWQITGGAAKGVIGSTSGTVELVNCQTNVADISSGTLSYNGLTQVDPLFSGFRSAASTGTYRYLPANQGSVQDVTKTAASLTITKNMQYVGVTSTAAARTLTLPDTATVSLKPFFGQTWTFADESGAAATNNITIATNGGTINGAASIVINTNYGSVQVVFDGTNYFTTSSGVGGFKWNDVSGAFSPLHNNGYFVTGTATGTLPSSPSQGDTIKFFVDHASQVLTIDAPGTQIIRMGSAVTAAGGTAVSTAQGDSVELTYRASDTCWCAIAGFSGVWNLT